MQDMKITYMKRLFALPALALFISSNISGQNNPFTNRNNEKFNDEILEKPIKKQYNIADGYWDDQNYDFALKIYKNIQKDISSSSFFNFKIGDCYSKASLLNNNDSALHYLSLSAENVSTDLEFDVNDNTLEKAPIFAYLEYARLLRKNLNINKAQENFKSFEEALGNKITDDWSATLKRENKICETAKLLLENPVDVILKGIDEINSEYSEYAPVVSADEQTMIFTSRRKHKGENTNQSKDPIDFKYYEDIYISKKEPTGKWGEPKLISDKINTAGHEATIGLSVDGQQLLIYSAQEDPQGDIYYSKLIGRDWSEPIAFEALNSKASETHACFSADGKTIFFTSNRKGGYGGFDIYRVTMLPNGAWSKPLNLGPKINTEFDDRAPFIHPDGVSLFFSSNGHETMGGFDIFQATDLGEDGWSTPENIGYPINTSDDDVFYATSVDGKRSYYASKKEEGKGENDLYIITIPKAPVQPMTIMSGYFSTGDGNGTIPADAEIIVKDNETGEIIGIFKPNRKTGKYLFILPPDKNYNVTYNADGFLFKSENLIVPKNSAFQSIKREIKLAPIKANESIVLNNVFFEYESYDITKDSRSELNKLFNLLSNNPSIKVEIQGHTDSKGKKAFNKKLSQKRAESVKNYLIKKGINLSRVNAVGYGEDQPIAKNTNSDGSDNEEGRKLNRRIELKVLSKDGEEKTNVNKIYVPDNLKN
jgi:outer membrane protein OmpA-like peptidoglycan-associated protein